MLPPAPVPGSAEFGEVHAIEVRRTARQGALRPILCACDDGFTYVVKPYSSGGAWPQIAEWVCARLGRAINLPIPNYRQVVIDEELANAWNATGGRSIEAGVGFGSQFVSSVVECSPPLVARIPNKPATALLAFDWWIRNGDRNRYNPNLLWSHSEERHFLIDHEKAGHTEGSEAFWRDHVLSTHVPWIDEETLAGMRSALSEIDAILAELPSSWTSTTGSIGWFVNHLKQSISEEPNKDWRVCEI